jgi:HAD superfamily hydrolase (TIGR01509 family)
VAEPPTRMRGGMIVDIDGTLVDSNYHHTIAWARAFGDHGVTVPLWRIHRHNGVGGDKLVAAVAGDRVEGEAGDGIRESEQRHYSELIDQVRPLPGARELLRALRDRGYGIVLASSAKREEVEAYLELLDARSMVDAWTSEADVAQTKPTPDLVEAAIATLPAAPSHLVIGDSTWDAVAAARAGVPAVGLLSGGFGRDELAAAGCAAIYNDALELVAQLDDATQAAFAQHVSATAPG